MRPSRKQSRFLLLAKNIAYQSNYGHFKHGALLVKGGSIINASCNKDAYNAFAQRFCCNHRGRATIHAEVGAVLGIDKSVTKGAVLYVVRISNNGEFRISKPCNMCMMMASFLGIDSIYYSTGDETNEIDVVKL